MWNTIVFVTPVERYCDEVFDGAGYTYSDEYGTCPPCKDAAECPGCERNLLEEEQ